VLAKVNEAVSLHSAMMDASLNERRRQKALADFGRQALLSRNLDAVYEDACVCVARGLGVEIAKIAVIQDDSDLLVLKGLVGLPERLARIGETKVPGGKNSAIGYAMELGRPVISDIATETRFDPSELVRKSGVRISANVVLWVDGKPYGGLEADSLAPWHATEADTDFLETYANLVSAAIQQQLFAGKVQTMLQERQVLLNEIFHRIKNLLANVLAIARRTASNSVTVEDFSKAFEGRIAALSRAHDLLLTALDQPAHLRDLLRLEFQAKGLVEGEQFEIQGPDLLCEPKAIQVLALLVFELATNAVKYGALSTFASPGPRIKVEWSVDAGVVEFRWREHGVAMQASSRIGFGSELIGKIVPRMLSGRTEVNRHDDGIECLATFPLPRASGVLSAPLQADAHR
jgi:two-component sensor histidine kinase